MNRNTFALRTLEDKVTELEEDIGRWMKNLKKDEINTSLAKEDIKEHINTLSRSLEEHRLIISHLKSTRIVCTSNDSIGETFTLDMSGMKEMSKEDFMEKYDAIRYKED